MVRRSASTTGSPNCSSRRSLAVAGRAFTSASARVGIHPCTWKASWSEPCSRSAPSTAAQRGAKTTRSIAIGVSSANLSRSNSRADSPGVRPSALASSADDLTFPDARICEEVDHAPAAHAFGERQWRSQHPRNRARRHEGALSPGAVEQPLVGKCLHRLACCHPAHPEALAQLGIRREPVTRPGACHQPPQVVGDLLVPCRGLSGHAPR